MLGLIVSFIIACCVIGFLIEYGKAILWLLLGLSVLGGVVGYTQEYGAVVPLLIGGAVLLFLVVFVPIMVIKDRRVWADVQALNAANAERWAAERATRQAAQDAWEARAAAMRREWAERNPGLVKILAAQEAARQP
jgi:hypothetical protein